MAIKRIFVEGKEDKAFIMAIIKIKLGLSMDDSMIVSTGGWTKLPAVKNLFDEVTDQGGLNLVIFDADTVNNHGGFEKRAGQLSAQFDELGINAELFLFPTNQDDGDFESLLELVINDKHEGVITCFSNYEQCVIELNEKVEGVEYKTPIRKAKIYSYIDVFPHSKKTLEKIKKGDYIYENSEFWDLDKPGLQPLIDFLQVQLS